MRTTEQLRDAACEVRGAVRTNPEALIRLREIAEEALRLAPKDADAVLINAWLKVEEGVRSGADLSLALEERKVIYGAVAGEFKRAIELGMAGYSRAPIMALVGLFKTWHYFQAGDEEGPAVCRDLLAMDCRGTASRHYQKAVVLSMYGPSDQPQLILSELDQAIALERHWASLFFRANVRKRLGDAEGSRKDEEEARFLKDKSCEDTWPAAPPAMGEE